jgi:uncharacterized protein (TIGR02246 family)
LWYVAVAAMLFCLTALPGMAEDSKSNPKEAEAIAKQAEAFVAAFDKGDAKALAAFWAPDGDYTDQSGKRLVGREAIEKAFEGLFSEAKGLKVGINSLSLRFVTPEVAVEDGVTEVYPPGGQPPSRARYTIVHVKKDGQWLLSSVRDAMFTSPSNYEHLRGLEGAIGDWAGDSESGETERLSLVWAENQNFITGSFATTLRHFSLGNMKVWIGWDPTAKNIRSWNFDAAGGFGEGAWTQEGKKWTIKTTTTLPDAKKVTGTLVLSLVDTDTIALQRKDASADGKPMPDTKEIKLKRIKNGQP